MTIPKRFTSQPNAINSTTGQGRQKTTYKSQRILHTIMLTCHDFKHSMKTGWILLTIWGIYGLITLILSQYTVINC